MAISFKRSRIMINQILNNPFDYLDKEVIVCGWVPLFRKKPPIYFLEVNDGSTIKNLQAVLDTELYGFSRGCSIKLFGKIISSPAEGQEIELKVENYEILGEVMKGYPINKQAKQLEYLRTIEHMRIRTNTLKSVHRIRNGLSYAVHNYFQKIGCQYVHTPILSGNDCEGAGETFMVTQELNKKSKNNIFKKPVYLTVSGQLHGESYACGLGDIYTFGPTFRAENSNTTRHLNEFWMIEPELCFINQDELHNLTEDFVKYCVNYVLENYKNEINFLDKELELRLRNMVEKEFKRLEYNEALKVLDEYPNEEKEEIKFGLDMNSSMEKFITKKFGRPVIVYNYPKEIKSFYMKSNLEPLNETVQAMDLLVPNIGELIGGSMREDNYNLLEKRLKENNITNLGWYLDLRKYGSVPHGGFGLGFERLVLLCTGMSNIRDVIPYPRYPKHIFA